MAGISFESPTIEWITGKEYRISVKITKKSVLFILELNIMLITNHET